MIINDDVSFGFTITNLLDDLTKIIMYHGDGEIDTQVFSYPCR